MNEDPASQNHMIDITDCLEAVSVFRGWKNFFFLILVICFLLAQGCFWLVDRGIVKVQTGAPSVEETIAAAANTTVTDANTASGPTSASRRRAEGGPLAKITYDHVARTVELVDGVLLVTAALYCMAMLFSLMVSLIGRLGGINHISRAFFLSLIMLVLVVPWQNVLGLNGPGVLYTPAELVTWSSAKTGSTAGTVFYYLRFTGYWAAVFLLLIMSQVRSGRWARSILRRLEII
jgi:hypothetical protein